MPQTAPDHEPENPPSDPAIDRPDDLDVPGTGSSPGGGRPAHDRTDPDDRPGSAPEPPTQDNPTPPAAEESADADTETTRADNNPDDHPASIIIRLDDPLPIDGPTGGETLTGAEEPADPSVPDGTTDTAAAPDAGLPSRHSVPLVLAAIAAILIGPIFADGSGTETGDDIPGQTQQDPDPKPNPGPASTASDGGELTIVDSGWSVFDDLSDDSLVSWAVVITNTSREMAVSGGVALTSDGGDVTIYGDAIAAAIPVLLPGDSITIGNTSYPDDPGFDDLDFELRDLQWWRPNDTAQPVDALRAGEIEVGWINQGETVPYWTSDGIESHVNEDGDMVVRFRVDSDYPKILDSPKAIAVFRDSGGKLLGATNPNDFDSWAEFPPGWSVQTLAVRYGPPEGTDEDKVDIQLYPGGGW